MTASSSSAPQSSLPTGQKPVSLYDTTLRDGTQAEGISFSVLDKLRVAERLDAFGIDYIEGGWPGSNPKDVEFFEHARRRQWNHAKIAAFGSTRRGGLSAAEDKQVQLLLDAQTPVVTLVGKSWQLHVHEVLKVTPEENLAMIRETCAFLNQNGREVIYDAEHFFDGYKDNAEYALSTLVAAANGGATMVVLCDTNGGALPEEVTEITRVVKERVPCAVGIHTHDDSGLGVANALAAIRAGATQVQGTINGYGERTGNCNLVTVIPNLQIKMGMNVVPRLEQLRDLSMFVDDLANVPHNIRAPYVGHASFSHKGGLHVNAVQKLARTYEHIDPSLVGNSQTILISELSGQSTVLLRAEKLGYKLVKGSDEVQQILQRVKEREHEGYEYEAAEASFDLLIRRILFKDYGGLFRLKHYHCDFRRTGDGGRTCEAVVSLSVGDEDKLEVAEALGPVEALDRALRRALRSRYPQIDDITLEDYKVRIIDGKDGTAARTRVLILSTDGRAEWGTVGCSYNIIQASWLALVDSYEYALLDRQKYAPQEAGT